jgi:hypothetical protein
MTHKLTRYFHISGIALLAVLTFGTVASARPPQVAFHGGFRGGFHRGFAGPRVGFVYGPGYGWYGPGYGWGGYGLGLYEPYGYVPGSDAGKVKFDTKAKESQVYVDGGYAGTVKQLGTFPLKAGAHDIELRHPDGQSFFQDHITVIAGKTAEVNPAPAVR